MTETRMREAARNAGIYQHNKAAKKLTRDGYIIIYNVDCTARIYIVDGDAVKCLATNASRHRAHKIAEAITAGRWNAINSDVRTNYLNNGYTTRRGLFAQYSEDDMRAMRRAALSHLYCDATGAEGHEARQELRRRL